MIKFLREERVIFYNIVRWIVLATLIGIGAGLLISFFFKILDWGSNIPAHYPWYFWLLPLVFILNMFLVKHFAPDAGGQGTEEVIQAVQRQSGKIKARLVPVKFVVTLMTIFAGGSVGKEGPAAQMSAGLASIASDVFKLSDADRKKLVICGFSAGFAAIFGTPISGAIFGIEVLFVGIMLYDVLLPSFMAGIAAYHVTKFFAVVHFQQMIHLSPSIDDWFILDAIVSGLFFGGVVLLVMETMERTQSVARHLKISIPLKGLIGGGIIIILALLFGTQTLGLGTDVILQVLSGTRIVWYLFLLKIVMTAITLHFGGSGGIISPLFFIGATSGAVFGHLMGADIATFAAIGFITVLGGAANAPIAMSIMALELFGRELAPYAAVACIVTYLISGHRSVYPSQIMAAQKALHINLKMGGTIDALENEFEKARDASFEE
jgi:H+/Cl- antiporter ClcA